MRGRGLTAKGRGQREESVAWAGGGVDVTLVWGVVVGWRCDLGTLISHLFSPSSLVSRGFNVSRVCILSSETIIVFYKIHEFHIQLTLFP